MVHEEKSTMLSVSSCVARTSDPFARKAGFEAMQRADQAKKATASNNGQSASGKNYGSWGPVFQNKQNFASMHFC